VIAAGALAAFVTLLVLWCLLVMAGRQDEEMGDE
jgi:hypothetical protein